MFEAAQQRLTEQRVSTAKRGRSGALPMGKPMPSRSLAAGFCRSLSRDDRAAHTICIPPIRSETRETLLIAIAKGRRWLGEIVDGTMAGSDAIVARERCSPRQGTRILSLTRLAPDLVEATVTGPSRVESACGSWSAPPPIGRGSVSLAPQIP